MSKDRRESTLTLLTASFLIQMMMMVQLVHMIVIRCTGNKETGFQSSKVVIGQDIHLFLVMRIKGSLMIIVRRSAIDVFVGMVGDPESSSVVPLPSINYFNHSNIPSLQSVSPRGEVRTSGYASTLGSVNSMIKGNGHRRVWSPGLSPILVVKPPPSLRNTEPVEPVMEPPHGIVGEMDPSDGGVGV